MLGFFVFVLLGMSPASQASEIGRWYRDVFLCAAATGVDGWKGASEGTIVALHFQVPAGGVQNACALTAVGVWQVCIVYSCLYCCELLFWIAGLSLRDLKSIYMAQTIVIFGARVLPLSPSIWNHPLSFQQCGALILPFVIAEAKEGLEGLQQVLQEQTWVLFPDDSQKLQDHGCLGRLWPLKPFMQNRLNESQRCFWVVYVNYVADLCVARMIHPFLFFIAAIPSC